MNTNLSQLFTTSELNLAAAILSLGKELHSLNKFNPKKAYFVFALSEDLQKLIDDYWANKLLVPARAYGENIKMLKSRIYGS